MLQNTNPLPITLEPLTSLGSKNHFSSRGHKEKQKEVIESYPLILLYKIAEFTTRQGCGPQLRKQMPGKQTQSNRDVAWV